MKSIKLIVILLTTLICIAFAGQYFRINEQSTHGFSLDISIPNYRIENLSDGYSKFLLDNAGEVTQPGYPELPLISEYFVQPSNYPPVVDVQVFESDTIFAGLPQPADVPRFENGDPDGIYPGDSWLYKSDNVWPSESYSVQNCGLIRGTNLGMLTFCPVRYDFASGNYIVTRKANMCVEFSSNIELPEERYRSRPFGELIREIAINGNSIPQPSFRDPGTYLIISADNCLDAMEDFALYKRHRGHHVIIKALSDFGPSPDPEDIKDYLQNQYDYLNPAPSFIILVGDVSMNDGTEFPDYGYETYTSDHPYSLLDGEDYFSDVFVARWPVDDVNECRVLSQKIQIYETTPTISGSDWLLRGEVSATYDHAVTPVWNVLWIRELLLRHGFTQVDTFFQNGSVIPSPGEIAGPINAGVAFIDYRGWGGSNGWWEPEFDRDDVVSLSNHNKFPVVTSIVCGTGDYGSGWTDPCFGETWLRTGSPTNPNGGVAFFGSTDHFTHTRYNNPINSGFYMGIFDHQLPMFAQCVWLGEAENWRQHPWERESTISLYHHSYEPTGDPGLMMYKGIPSELEVVRSDPIGNGSFMQITVTKDDEPVADARVCLYNRVSQEMVVDYTDIHGFVEMLSPPARYGEVTLTVISPFAIPYIEEIDITGEWPIIFIDDFVVQDTIDGNGDNILEPGEIADLIVTIENGGPGARRMETYLWTDHPGIDVTSAFDSVNSFWGGLSHDFRFRVNCSGFAAGEGDVCFNILCDTREGYKILNYTLPIAPGGITIDSIRFDDSAGGDGDNMLEPGETADASILFTNRGPEEIQFDFKAYSNTGWIESDLSAAINSGTIGAHSSQWSNQFEMTALGEAFHGHPVKMEIYKIAENPHPDKYVGKIDFKTGVSIDNDPSGPDEWGYFAYDDSDIASGHAPETGFTDISTSGTFVEIDDDQFITLELPVNFVFYGESFDTLTVCSNGWAAPGVQPYFMVTFYNNDIPSPNGPWGTLAPFWDDLEPSGSPESGLYYEYFASDDKFIVQWHEMIHAREYPMENTFQLVIYDSETYPTRTGDSEIEFCYSGSIEDEDSTEEYSTVGIESPDHTMGEEYLFSNVYDPGASVLQDGRVIKYTTNCGAGLLYGQVELADGAHPSCAYIQTDNGQKISVNRDGSYYFREVPTGMNIIDCVAKGYFTKSETLDFDSEETIEHDYTLQSVPIPQFTGITQGDGSTSIELYWNELSDDLFALSGYYLYKYSAPGGVAEVISVSDTFYSDTAADNDRKYWYRIAADYSGNISALSPRDSGWVELLTEIDEGNLPEKPELSISPNPFNSVVKIDVNCPGESKLFIYNVAGKLIYKRQINSKQTEILWDATDNRARAVSSGIYLVKLVTPENSLAKKVIFIK